MSTNLLASKSWRMNHLYKIIDKSGNSIPFKLNHIQQNVLDNLHTRNLILKCRQVGMSTFSVLYLLDEALYTKNLACGIVSYSREHVEHIFKRIIGHALDNLNGKGGILSGVLNRSAREITFSNGSFLRVDTTLRGAAYQLVLVSEFGKTCARNPMKAEEVVTGTLETVSDTGRIIIESTGEGNSGYYADMVNQASQRGNDDLNALEYKLFFFPWFIEDKYRMQKDIEYPVELTDYFNKLESDLSITIDKKQRNWYAAKKGILGDKTAQEFPSTISEAFITSSDAYYFQVDIQEAYKSNRMLSVSPFDPLEPLYLAMDIGATDLTVMVFFQVIHGEIRIVDHYADNNKSVPFYCRFLQQDKKYLYHTIFLPHDAARKDGIIVENTYKREFTKLFSHTETRISVLKRTDKNVNISNAKIKLERCVFYLNKTRDLIEHLQKYRKKWSEQYGKYLDEPFHDLSCFIGETKILTSKGEIRIDEIKVGDKVITPSGEKKVLRKFIKKTKYLINIKTKRHSLICTKEHEIFTEKGLIKTDSLSYSIHLLTYDDREIWRKISYLGREKKLGFKDYFLSMNQKQLFGLMGLSIKKTNMDIGKEEVPVVAEPNAFIGQSGCITTEKYLKGCTFTTLMKINQIIKSKIFNLFIHPIIQLCILMMKKEKDFFLFMQKRLKKLKNGILLKKVENGIENMQKSNLKKENSFKKNAQYAQKNSKQNGIDVGCVQINAEQKIGETRELMMKKESATFVNQHSTAINTQKKERVLELVPQHLDTEIDVYDLEIEDDHCYFANKILVSNSHYADAFIYAMQAVTHLEAAGQHGNYLEKHKQITESRRYKI